MATATTAEAGHQPASRGQDQVGQRLRVAQAVAGSVFSVFVGVHLINLYLAPFGPDTFNAFQRLARTVYQFPPVEVLVIFVPLLVHAICGVWLMVRNRGRGGQRSLRARLHTWAGLFLLLFITGHIAAVRGPSFFFGVFPEFEGLSFSLWFFPAYFYPYYFLLAVAGFYHAATGLTRAGARFGWRLPRRLPAAVMAAAALWTLVSLMALDGRFFEVQPQAQSRFAQLGSELFDIDPTQPWR